MKVPLKFSAAVILTITLITGNLFADLAVAKIFSNNMVLQRNQPVPVWGWADPESEVEVRFQNQIHKTVTTSEGNWEITLDALEANKQPGELKVSNLKSSEYVNFTNILVGEVWLCSGQSNMNMALKQSENPEEAILQSANPMLRFFTVRRDVSKTPKPDLRGLSWAESSPKTSAEFSGVGYYFGRKLQQDLDVPVGLIASSWSGTRIAPWYPGEIPPPSENGHVIKLKHTPSAIYNGMIYPIRNFAIRGVLWYQGESNRRNGHLYRDESEGLITAWRKQWGYDFPFYLVQIAPYNDIKWDAELTGVFWEAQSNIVKTVPNTGMVVISDSVTDLNNVHPPNKIIPGTRLANLALAKTYGKDILAESPRFTEATVKGEQLILSFDFATGLTTRDGKAPDWFEWADAEGNTSPAAAAVDGETVVLTLPDDAAPTELRFAWSEIAIPNLMNESELPAEPFRTPVPGR